MTLTLDAESAQRIQREIARSHDREPAEVVARALTLLEADEAWAEEDKTDLNQRLAASLAQADSGELYTGEEARELLAERRAQRQG